MDEVAVQPLPNLRARITDLDPQLEAIMQSALQRSPSKRVSAAQFAGALDQWVLTQAGFASPDRLQAHLLQLFPTDYKARTREETSFGNLRGAIGKQRGSTSILKKLFGQ